MTDAGQEQALELAGSVLRIRIAQLLVNQGLKDGQFKIPLHLALGHEAVAAAMDAVMQSDDQLLLTHRNIHYNLSRCQDFAAEYLEYQLAPGGMAGGRLGSMNLSNATAGIPYSSSILGNNLPLAAGMALAEQVTHGDAVIFVVTGDGAMEEGVFYESLLFMRSQDLRAVVVVENNDWSLATRTEQRRAGIDLGQFCRSMAVPFTQVDGADAYACRRALGRARAVTAETGIPVVLEVPLTTLGHWYVADPGYPETGRFINYHHGAAPEAELADWPVLAQDGRDPVHVLDSYVAPAATRALAKRIRQELQVQLP